MEPQQQGTEPHTGSQRREFSRQPCTLSTYGYAVREGGEKRLAAQVLDVSRDGIGLALPCPVAPGTILGIDIPHRSWRRPRRLLKRVVHTTALADGTWRVGCEFAFRLSESEFRAYGTD